MNEYLHVLRHYATFNGRARRREFWMFRLVNGVIVLALAVLSLVGIVFDSPDRSLAVPTVIGSLLLVLYGLATFIPHLAVTVRRLHDAGFSGWLVLLEFISLGIVVLVLNIMDSTPGANKWGTNPKGVRAPDSMF